MFSNSLLRPSGSGSNLNDNSKTFLVSFLELISDQIYLLLKNLSRIYKFVPFTCIELEYLILNSSVLKHFSKTTFYKKKKIAILEFANLYLGLF
ncbi:hypothetical protein E1I74_04055 [Mycoplasmopsis cynos]|nr:hypothetical protein E1I74_04055 [Mycoplasmopsis cynos]